VPENYKNKNTKSLDTADVVRDVEKGTEAVISCDSSPFLEQIINYLLTNFRAISAQK